MQHAEPRRSPRQGGQRMQDNTRPFRGEELEDPAQRAVLAPFPFRASRMHGGYLSVTMSQFGAVWPALATAPGSLTTIGPENAMAQRALVVGATGIQGSAVAERSAADGWKVFGLGLSERDIERLASPWHVDADLGSSTQMVTDMSKSRQRGFTGYIPTHRALYDHLSKSRDDEIIPRY